MQILKVQDPRSNLERARRSELLAFAKQNNVTEIVPQMPANLMRKILKAKGLTSIQIQQRQLGEITRAKIDPRTHGRPAKPEMASEKGAEIDADEDLARQWLNENAAKASTAPQKSKLVTKGPTMAEVRRQCTMRGIRFKRSSTMAELMELLNGKNAS